MTAIPAVMDALVALWRAATIPGITSGQVYDGQPVEEPKGMGLAVGATVTDTRAEFLLSQEDFEGDESERSTIPCLLWSGSGDTAFKPHRDAVDAALDAIRAALNADRSLGGLVGTVGVTDGSIGQNQAGGALVTCEFSVEFTIV